MIISAKMCLKLAFPSHNVEKHTDPHRQSARKFTAAEGRVELSATETPDYVEISVSDTGQGMTDEQLAHLFDAKPIVDEDSNSIKRHNQMQESHGFGLLNCKGIIEKYRKLSNIFSVCKISAESTPYITCIIIYPLSVIIYFSL